MPGDADVRQRNRINRAIAMIVKGEHRHQQNDNHYAPLSVREKLKLRNSLTVPEKKVHWF